MAQSLLVKGIVHPKRKRKIFWRMWETELFWGTIDFHSIFYPTMKVNGAPKQPAYKLSSKYLPLCSAKQRNSYRFGTTWGWVNDDRIVIFEWIIPFIMRKLWADFSKYQTFRAKAAPCWRSTYTVAMFTQQSCIWVINTGAFTHTFWLFIGLTSILYPNSQMYFLWSPAMWTEPYRRSRAHESTQKSAVYKNR